MPYPKPFYFRLLGLGFLILAGFTLLNVYAGWHFGDTVSLRGLGYALMDLLVAWGFFRAERWILYAFILALIGNVLLISIKLSSFYNAEILRPVIAVLLASLVIWLVYRARRVLHTTPVGKIGGVVFCILWAYTFIGNISAQLISAL